VKAKLNRFRLQKHIFNLKITPMLRKAPLEMKIGFQAAKNSYLSTWYWKVKQRRGGRKQ
jgi:hypothetical protein